MSGLRTLVLQRGREAPVRGGHPWIFSRAIASGLEGAEPGEPVRVVTGNGRFVAAGYVNPRTTIAVRVLTLEDEPLDEGFVARRLERALLVRRTMLPPTLSAWRILNGEGDGLPGIVADRYGDFVVCQFLTAGAARLAEPLVAALERQLAPRGIYERSEGGVRADEGLGGHRGVLAGEEPPPRLTIEEDGVRFLVDVIHGQKTGFFLDQRETRARVRALATGRRVLNAFAYTGAISAAAGLGEARQVVSVDSSAPALALAEETWAANGLSADRGTFVAADVFDFLREQGDPFDAIVLDPPPFVRRRRDLEAGLRGYRDINLQALRRLTPGGWLLTTSCSQHVAREQFRAVVAAAAADAGRPATILSEWGHAADHPVALAHPEADYLKVMLVSV